MIDLRLRREVSSRISQIFGTMIAHAFCSGRTPTGAASSLAIAMIVPAFRRGSMPATSFAQALVTTGRAACRAAIPVASIARTADRERRPTSIAFSRPQLHAFGADEIWTRDPTSGMVLARLRAPRVWAIWVPPDRPSHPLRQAWRTKTRRPVFHRNSPRFTHVESPPDPLAQIYNDDDPEDQISEGTGSPVIPVDLGPSEAVGDSPGARLILLHLFSDNSVTESHALIADVD